MAVVPIIRVFISSPGDVNDERKIALDVIEQFPYRPVFREKVAFRVVAWDKPGADTPMRATLSPQEAINQGLPKPSESDIVIVLFWSRMGTPFTDVDGKEYLSGTHWELLDGLPSETTETLIYRRTEEKLFRADQTVDQEQYLRVNDFFQSELFFKADGSIQRGVNQYESPEDFRRAFSTHLEALVLRYLQGVDLTQLPESTPSLENSENITHIEQKSWDREKSPFPGLRSFTEDDANIFFGRGRETDALIKQVAENPFVAVVGASGSGKSSLVGAGLIPRLRQRAIEGSHSWDIVSFTPGENVFKSLANALMETIPSLEAQSPRTFARELDEFTDDLLAGVDRLSNTISHVLKDEPDFKKIVFFIDQFEELFTLTDETQRENFVKVMADVIFGGRVQVIVTLRADFYHRAMDYPELSDMLYAGNFNLTAPRRDALRDMIEYPAQRAGLDIESGLVDTILDDTGDEPGNLALMAYLLDELYHLCKEGGKLTLEAYEQLGGVQGAIGERAEAVFNKIKGDETDKIHAIQSIFPELVDVDDNGNATRRRYPYQSDKESELIQVMVTELIDARLLTSSQDMLEVAHEALLREWTRLASWIQSEQDNLRLRRRITNDANNWKRNSKSQDALYRGGILSEAVQFIRQNPRIDELVVEYVHAGEQAETERIRLAQEQEDRINRLEQVTQESKDQAQVAGQRTRIALIATIAAVIIGLIAGGLALTAQQAQQESDNRAITADAQVVLAENAQQEADDRAITADAQVAIAGETLTPIPPTLTEVSNEMNTAEAERDNAGTQVANAARAENDALLREQDISTQVATAQIGLTEVGEQILSQKLAIRSDDIYNSGDRDLGLALAIEANRISNPPPVSQNILAELAYQPDQRRKFVAGHTSQVWSVAFSPDGSQIVSGSDDQTLILWDVDSGELLRRFEGHTSTVYSVAFSPDGSQIVSGSDDQTLILWDVDSGELLRRFEGHTNRIRSVAFSPDGSQIVSGSVDQTLILWDVHSTDQLLWWTKTNRLIESLTCQHRSLYGVKQCVNGVSPISVPFNPTRIPFPVTQVTPIHTPTPSQTPFPTPIPTIASPTPSATPTATSTPNATETSEAGIALTATATLWTATPTPTITLTPTITPTTSPPRTGVIGENPGEIDIGWYERWVYDGQADEVLTFRVNPDNPAQMSTNATRVPDGFDSLLIIYNPDGSELAMNDDIENSIQTNSLIANLVLPEDGTYVIEVRSWDDLSGGSYTLIISDRDGAEITATP